MTNKCSGIFLQIFHFGSSGPIPASFLCDVRLYETLFLQMGWSGGDGAESNAETVEIKPFLRF